MNKNLNNPGGKRTQKDQLQNQGNREKGPQSEEQRRNTDRKKEIHPVEPLAEKNLNRKKEIPRMESWSRENTDREKEIQSTEQGKNVDSKKEINHLEQSAEKNLNQEKELPRMESWTKENSQRKKGINPMESWVTNNSHPVDGLRKPSFQTSTINNHAPASITTTNGQVNNLNKYRDSKVIEFKDPSKMGSALYVIAAILLIAWSIGFFYYNAGPIIHIVLVLALISVLIKVAQVKSY